jgi:hypothetical protein
VVTFCFRFYFLKILTQGLKLVEGTSHLSHTSSPRQWLFLGVVTGKGPDRTLAVFYFFVCWLHVRVQFMKILKLYTYVRTFLCVCYALIKK